MKAATSIPRILAAWLLGSVGALAAGCGADGTADGASLPPDDRVQAVGQVAERKVAGAPDAAPDAAPEIAPALADGRFPPDFGLDVTVLLGPGAPELLDAQDRQAKYIVLPDGSLHSDASPFIDVSTRPGRARWLYEDQMQFLWSLCTQTGFAQERDANGPPNPDMLVARRGERLVILTLRADGRTWTYVRRAPGVDPMDPAAARIVRALAILSWIPDYRPEDVAPERYDFGPDPYAVYREIRDRRGVSKVR